MILIAVKADMMFTGNSYISICYWS